MKAKDLRIPDEEELENIEGRDKEKITKFHSENPIALCNYDKKPCCMHGPFTDGITLCCRCGHGGTREY